MARTKINVDSTAKKEIKAYQQALKNAKIPVEQLIIFGSRVTGHTHAGSDIDVAVVSPKFGRDYHQELVMLLAIRGRESLMIEPHPIHPDDLDNEWDTFINEIKTKGIPVDLLS